MWRAEDERASCRGIVGLGHQRLEEVPQHRARGQSRVLSRGPASQAQAPWGDPVRSRWRPDGVQGQRSIPRRSAHERRPITGTCASRTAPGWARRRAGVCAGWRSLRAPGIDRAQRSTAGEQSMRGPSSRARTKVRSTTRRPPVRSRPGSRSTRGGRAEPADQLAHRQRRLPGGGRRRWPAVLERGGHGPHAALLDLLGAGRVLTGSGRAPVRARGERVRTASCPRSTAGRARSCVRVAERRGGRELQRSQAGENEQCR